MRQALFLRWLLILPLLAMLWVSDSGAGAQTPPQEKKTERERRDEPSSDVIKVETALVTIPVIVSDRQNAYIPDLRQDEFTVYEEGAKQEIVFFATIREPFHVVLMLDTSASTQEKLGPIQRAAAAFVRQLQPADRLKIISFDDEVRELSDFSSDRGELIEAINRTRPGQGTKLYDAMKLALNNLARIKGRQAIVIFTDGVDYRSDATSFEDNVRQIEESGIIIYPIRYETRAETEELVRRQTEQYGDAVDVGLILGGPPIGTTPPTTPGEGPGPLPRRPSGSAGSSDPYRLPVPPIVIARPPIGRYPGGGRYPDDRYPDSRDPNIGGGRLPVPGIPDNRYPGGRYPDDRFPDASRPNPPSRRGSTDSTTVLLDALYRTGDHYLDTLARISGGKLHRADQLGDLPSAFARIADELRQQYSIGYYPSSTSRDGKFRKVVVRASRPNAVVRARPGYRTSP